MEKLINILNLLIEAKLVQNRDGLFELRHDSLAGKIATKLTAEEIGVNEAVNTIRNTFKTKGKLTEDQIIRIQPFEQRLAITFKEDERPRLLDFYKLCVKEVNAGKKEKLQQQQQIRESLDAANAAYEAMFRSQIKVKRQRNLATIFGIFSFGFLIIAVIFFFSYKRSEYNSHVESAKMYNTQLNYHAAIENYQEAKKHTFFKDDSLDILIDQCYEQQQAKSRQDSLVEAGQSFYAQGDYLYTQNKEGENLPAAYYNFLRASQTDTLNDLYKKRLDFIKKEMTITINNLRIKAKKFRAAEGYEEEKIYSDMLTKLENAIRR